MVIVGFRRFDVCSGAWGDSELIGVVFASRATLQLRPTRYHPFPCSLIISRCHISKPTDEQCENRSLSFRNEVGKEFPLGIGSEHFPDWHRDMLKKKNCHNIEKKHIHHFKSVDFHTSNIKVWDPDLTKVVVVKVVLLILQKAMKSGSSEVATGDVMI